MKVPVLRCSDVISRDGASLAFLLDDGGLVPQLSFISAGNKYPIYITHTKPAETDLIMAFVACLPARSLNYECSDKTN